MISFPRQYVWFVYGMSRMVVKQEVKYSQIQGPTSLMMVKFFGHHEKSKVLVVSLDLHWIGRSFQKVSPLF